jgi:hypothetical protein
MSINKSELKGDFIMNETYICNCSREFPTQMALNAHQVSHKEKVARYSVSRKNKNSQNPSTYNCLYCGVECTWGTSKINKYCSNVCQGKYRWENEALPAIKAGTAGGGVLKKFLIEQNNSCSSCGQGNIWNEKPLKLQLDHIDGNSDNNTLDNVRLLCPNCHTQTDNFGSKGIGNRYKKINKRNVYLQRYKANVV